MIRIVLLGRTGNNLFQYAFGRVLAERHGVPLILDGSWFDAAGWEQVSQFLRLPLRAKVVRRCSLGARALRKATGRHYWEYRGVPVLRERPDDQSFDPALLEAPADCVMMGYFQTPRYFDGIERELRKEINSLLAAGVEAEPGIVAALGAPGAVAVHVRRGDFLNLPVFRVCGSDYQRRAMDRMRGWIDKPKFHVFSDDPAWCRREFTDGDQVVMDGGSMAANPLHDLRLMSLASHHIIVNSSYSWWAAWLGRKPGQRVIMPDRWYTAEIKAPVEEKRLEHWTVLR